MAKELILSSNERLESMRRIRRALYWILFIVMIVAIVFTLQSPSVGATIKPLFLPIFPIAQMLLFFGFAGTIVGFVFRYMEIKMSQGDTDKYTLAKSSVSVSRFTWIVALVFMLMLLLPPVLAMINQNISTTEEKTVENTTTFKWQFGSSDSIFRAVYVSHIVVESDIPVDMYLLTSRQLEDFEAANFTSEPVNGTSAILCAKKVRTLEWPISGGTGNLAETGGYGDCFVVIINNGTYSDKDAKVSISANRQISDPLLGMLVLFSGMFFVANLIWMFMMVAVKGRYKRSSMIK